MRTAPCWAITASIPLARDLGLCSVAPAAMDLMRGTGLIDGPPKVLLLLLPPPPSLLAGSTAAAAGLSPPPASSPSPPRLGNSAPSFAFSVA